MARRKYQFVWDEVAFLNSDFIAGWEGGGAFNGYSGPIEYDLEQVAYDLQAAHLEHDRETDRVSLFYTIMERGEVKPIRANVRIERQPCQFGGSRVYFLAPCCGRRVRQIALLPAGVKCGPCGLVTHKARRQGRTARLVRRADLLAGKLGCKYWHVPPTERPKGMRRETFDRLMDEHAQAVSVAMRVILPRLARAARRGPAAHFGAMLRAGM